jgi:hypothetical protein
MVAHQGYLSQKPIFSKTLIDENRGKVTSPRPGKNKIPFKSAVVSLRDGPQELLL